MLLEEMMRNEKQEGRQEIAVQFLLDSLNSKFSVSTALSKKISSETDMNKLQSWFQLSLKVTSLEDFEKNMDIAYAFVNALGKAPDKKALGSEKAK